MDLSKAIQLVSDSAQRGMTTFDQDFKDAQILLIECAIAIQAWRRDWNADRFHLLPRETPTPRLRQPTPVFGNHKP